MKKFLISFFLIAGIVFGQELDAKVDVILDKVPVHLKDRLANFQGQMSDYLNNTSFTEDAWEWPKIKCYFQIFFTNASSNDQYKAQVIINSQRALEGREKSTLMLNIKDNTWEFAYDKSQVIMFDMANYDDLTSFLDYYALVIIGTEMDSYDPPFAGNDAFTRAYNISVMGSASSSEAWKKKSNSYSKRGFIEEVTNATYQQFREDFCDYHFNGLDLYYKNKKMTYTAIRKMVKNLLELKKKINKRSILLNSFFDAKSREIIDYMKETEDREVFEWLKRVDPNHVSAYIEALEEL